MTQYEANGAFNFESLVCSGSCQNSSKLIGLIVNQLEIDMEGLLVLQNSTVQYTLHFVFDCHKTSSRGKMVK